MKRKKQLKKNKIPKKVKGLKKSYGWTVFTLTFVFLVLIGFTAYGQLKRYESGILDVYAHQQDGYVQLVLDQINIIGERSSEEIVTEILASLDASTYRYWTFEEDQSLVFVKDVLETNKYKSFTSQTYYAAVDIETFITKLRVNSVIHDIIKSKNDTYVTSGVKFEYGGKNYTLCLMTESHFILDQNEYMGAKIVLSMLGMLLLVVFFIGVMALVLQTEKWYRLYSGENKENKELTAIIERLNEQLSKDMLFNTQHGSFLPQALPVLFERIQLKDALPLLMLVVKAEKGEERAAFFENTFLMLDRRTIRVIVNDAYVMLIILKMRKFSSEKLEEMEQGIGKKICGYKYVGNPEASLSEVYETLLKEVKERG